MIDPDFFSPKVRQGKLLLRKLWLIPVSKSHLGAGKAQLTRKSPRKQPSVWIHNICKTVMNRTSNGYRPVIPCLIDFVIGGIYRKLRRAISIVDRSSRLRHSGHRLSANTEVIHIERLI